VDWIKRFVLHFDKRHPADGRARSRGFSDALAVQGKVAAATESGQGSAAVFYREVPGQDLPWLQNLEQA